MIVSLLLANTCVNHILNIRHCERCLCNGSGDHNLPRVTIPRGRREKCSLLFRNTQCSMKSNDVQCIFLFTIIVAMMMMTCSSGSSATIVPPQVGGGGGGRREHVVISKLCLDCYNVVPSSHEHENSSTPPIITTGSGMNMPDRLSNQIRIYCRGNKFTTITNFQFIHRLILAAMLFVAPILPTPLETTTAKDTPRVLFFLILLLLLRFPLLPLYFACFSFVMFSPPS
mmetsp:Transcript_29396/g.40801  ORF Transcript_29396/g.40801 Transcript_29396/m.40801 type:complete len:228 (-) Transcript_29396:1247-1930(-)